MSEWIAQTENRRLVIVAGLGAIGGAALTLLFTRAAPKMMSQMMKNMMGEMRERMKDAGCNPEEM